MGASVARRVAFFSVSAAAFTAPDLEHGGAERTIIVYYVYYR